MDQAICKIKKIIDKLYDEDGDGYLFDCKICERSLMFRFAHYLQKEFSEHFVDCEFNKMGFDGYKAECKMIYNSVEHKVKKMYVDIIVHKRNSKVKDNHICIELKRTRRGMSTDFERLKIMTSKEGFFHNSTQYRYCYEYGFFILLPKKKKNAVASVFQSGELKASMILNSSKLFNNKNDTMS